MTMKKSLGRAVPQPQTIPRTALRLHENDEEQREGIELLE
jgi:hypothetical protein